MLNFLQRMQICATFGLYFLHTLALIIFPTGNACVPAGESPPWQASLLQLN